MKDPDLLFERQRAEALAHPDPCEYCKAPTGQLCANPKTGVPIEHQAAHWLRLVATRQVTS